MKIMNEAQVAYQELGQRLADERDAWLEKLGKPARYGRENISAADTVFRQKYIAGTRKIDAPRYGVVEGSETSHCCFDATIVDFWAPEAIGPNVYFMNICETLWADKAQTIADALNAMEKKDG